MRTAMTELLGVDYPIVGFNRSPGVVAAVTNAGGFGVLAASAYTPEELDAQLTWIEEQVQGKPYGVDLLVPEKFAAGDPNDLIASLRAQIPAQHFAFVRDLLERYDIPPAPEGTASFDEIAASLNPARSRRGWHRLRSADGRRAGVGRGRCLVWFGVAVQRGGRRQPGHQEQVPRRHQLGHRAVPDAHREAGPTVAFLLARRVGDGRRSRAVAHATAAAAGQRGLAAHRRRSPGWSRRRPEAGVVLRRAGRRLVPRGAAGRGDRPPDGRRLRTAHHRPRRLAAYPCPVMAGARTCRTTSTASTPAWPRRAACQAASV